MIHVRMANALKAMLFASVLATLTPSAQGAQETPASVDAAFEQFWAARSPGRAERRVETVVDTGVTFDDAFERLARGRDYSPQATGVLAMNNRTDSGIEHYYSLNVRTTTTRIGNTKFGFSSTGVSEGGQTINRAVRARLTCPAPSRSTSCPTRGWMSRGGVGGRSPS